MLAQLKIKNFAIIDDITISFNDKMTVLTGETGSGKSIIIDAINMLLGERASIEMIRHDKDKAIIEGIFYYENKFINKILDEYGINHDDNCLIIVRELAKNGRNICRVNGSLATVNQLKNMGVFLIDVHVQNDTTRLINANNYLNLIDSFANEGFNDILNKYRDKYSNYQRLMRKYNNLIKENVDNKEKLEFYKFQFEEFKQAKLSLDEYQKLLDKRNIISNYDKIYDNLNKAYNNIKENKVLESIYESSNNLNKISDINTKFSEISEQLLNVYYLLEDNFNLVSDEINSLDYNPKELDVIESRLSIYSHLKRKYNMEIETLIDYKDNLQNQINNIDNYDYLLNDLKDQIKDSYNETISIALKLRELRKQIAGEIEQTLVKHLTDLKLQNTIFNIIFNDFSQNNNEILNSSIFKQNGIDEIDFFVSFNKGEPTRPLSKVASGGELSRFMLALKTILTSKQNLSTIIFDEIDTGVSGITASAIAKKIKSISNNTQVLCITHLPQVASIADYHFYISKKEVNERTNTFVTLLDQENRVLEIAKMIAGDNVNEYVIENAKNLLKII